MHQSYATLARIVSAIGETDFPAEAAGALCDLADFDLAAVILHRSRRDARLVFDNFDRVEGRRGIEAYVRTTRRMNPIVAGGPYPRAVRARDFAARSGPASAHRDIVRADDEELGYRTVGWPARQEEIGLYFPMTGGLMEIGLYRARRARPAAPALLSALDAMIAPVAAAFDRHAVLQARPPVSSDAAASEPAAILSRREEEVCHLLLLGCSTEAIALRLSISRFTVKDHRKSIFRKLGISALAELFALAHRFPLWRDGIAGHLDQNGRGPN